MSTISIPLPDEDLEFLRSLASEQGTTPEQFLAKHARNLRLNLQAAVHPLVSAATGVLQAENSPQTEYLEFLEQKHR
jgi:hypothetical protein